MNNFCVNCGSKLPENVSFCTKCGSKVEKTNNVINTNDNSNFNNVVNSDINSKKPKKKKHGCLITFLIFILLIAGFVCFVLYLTKPKEQDVSIKVDKDYQYLAVSNDNEYMISNADSDIYFYVTSGNNYRVLDENGNEVVTEFKDNKIINPSGYEKGKQYSIELNDGSFVSGQLENTKKVTFKIMRDEVREYEFNENVINVDFDDIVLSDDSNSFVSSTKYDVGDVITVGESDSLTAAYVITSVDGNNYKIRDAQLDEIFSKLNYYYEAPADLTDVVVSEQFKEYVINNVKSSAWFSFIVDEVYADPLIKVEIDEEDDGIKVNVKIKIPAGKSSLLMTSKNHDIEIIFTQKLAVSNVVDITLTNWDVKLDITSGQDFEIKIENKFLDYSDAETEKATIELMEKLRKALEQDSYRDSDEKGAELATILIPTGIPCLNVKLELELVNEISASVDFGVKFGQTTNVVVGFDYGLGEEFEFVGSYDKEYSDVTLSFAGKIEEKFGVEVSVGLDILNVVSATADVATGLYTEAEMGIENKFGNGYSFDTNLKVENGIFLEFGVSAELGDIELSHKFVEQNWPIIEKEWNFSKSFNQNGEVILDSDSEHGGTGGEYGYSFTQDKDRLEQYSCVDSIEDESYVKYKFNYENGDLKNIELIGAYFVDTGVESVDSFLKLLIRVIAVYCNIEYKVLSTYYENGKYSYIVVELDKEEFEQEFGEVNSEDYYSFKIKMQENGYVCK